MTRNFWDGFREELIITSVILGLAVISSFFVISRMYPEDKKEEKIEELEQYKKQDIAQQIDDAMGIVMGDQNVEETDDQIETSKQIENKQPSPTLGPMDTEIIFGVEGQYSYDAYQLNLNQPRISYNLQEKESKKFVVNVTLKNIDAVEGLPMNLFASIIKDGSLLAPKVAMSTTESKIVLPGEEVVYQARVSLVEGTDVKEIFYEPKTQKDQVVHILNAQ